MQFSAREICVADTWCSEILSPMARREWEPFIKFRFVFLLVKKKDESHDRFAYLHMQLFEKK